VKEHKKGDRRARWICPTSDGFHSKANGGGNNFIRTNGRKGEMTEGIKTEEGVALVLGQDRGVSL